MIYLLLAAVIFLIDGQCKIKIEKQQDNAFPMTLKGGILLEKHHNKGFLLNRLDDRPLLVRAVSVLVMVPLIFWAVFLFFTEGGRKGPAFLRFLGKTGAAFLLGGASSNLYDRLARGYVVDFIRFPGCKCKKIRNIIFNIADFFLFLGAALSALYGLFSK